MPGVWYSLCVLHYKVWCMLCRIIWHDLVYRRELPLQLLLSTTGRNGFSNYTGSASKRLHTKILQSTICRQSNSTLASNILHFCTVCHTLYWKVRTPINTHHNVTIVTLLVLWTPLYCSRQTNGTSATSGVSKTIYRNAIFLMTQSFCTAIYCQLCLYTVCITVLLSWIPGTTGGPPLYIMLSNWLWLTVSVV